MKNKIILSLLCGILVLVLTSGCDKKNNLNFEDNVILNHLTIDDVKISELNTINDILNNFKGSQILNVVVCYEGEEENGCPSYSYDKFLTEDVSKINVSTISFNIFVLTNQKNLMVIFSTFYDVYKDKQNDSPYYRLELLESPGTIKLDGAYIELLPFSDIKAEYDVASRSNEYMYYIDFESKTKDKYYFTGYTNKSYIEIFNISERDRNIK